jgi:hypothetical protein
MLSDPLEDVLPRSHHKALLDAIDMLVDEGYEDIAALRDGEELDHTGLLDFLPPRYRHRYTVLFAKQFHVSIIMAAWKLHAPGYTSLSCVAEELALAAIIQRAATLLEADGETPDFMEFEDSVFEDMDFEQLWDPSLDGLAETEVGRALGMPSLDFRNWFTPFRPERPVHPYVKTDTNDVGHMPPS